MFSSFGFGEDSKSVLAAIDKSLAIIEFDMKGKVLAANENFCRALGYEAAEIVGKRGRRWIPTIRFACQGLGDNRLQVAAETRVVAPQTRWLIVAKDHRNLRE